MLAPLSSHTPVEEPAGKQFVRKPTPTGRQAHIEPTSRNPKRYETSATPTRIIQSGTYERVDLRCLRAGSVSTYLRTSAVEPAQTDRIAVPTSERIMVDIDDGTFTSYSYRRPLDWVDGNRPRPTSLVIELWTT